MEDERIKKAISLYEQQAKYIIVFLDHEFRFENEDTAKAFLISLEKEFAKDIYNEKNSLLKRS